MPPPPPLPPPLKITKKHHKHLNYPFPCPPRSLPIIHGTLSSNPGTHPNPQLFPIGTDYHLTWTSSKAGRGGGGYLSISHQSQPNRALWSTVPGEAFVSAAVVQTEVVESRGSFVVKDGHVLAICKHQSLEDVRVVHQHDLGGRSQAQDELLHGMLLDSDKDRSLDVLEETQFPICVVTGWVYSKKNVERPIHGGLRLGCRRFRCGRSRKPSITARYCVVLDQKINSSQIGFCVRFGEISQQPGTSPFCKNLRISNNPRWKSIRRRLKRKPGCCFLRSRGFTSLSSDDEGGEKDVSVFGFNRVLLTYLSEEDERFFGFGEQFSHVEFKGKRVPIFVQEQGIGRGDQPISLAANLLSYRAGGDWSTTYAPSPFYMTSKMRSMYLEGYEYSIFDLTELDRVQIQIHSDSVRARILHGDSPVELIEQFTGSIGRPAKLPNWIISGAVIGMQGGTKVVRRVWDHLKDYDVPISAFWLQDWVGERKTMIGSQLWWNWELDSTQYGGWEQLVKDFRSHGIRVMAYCNPCLTPVFTVSLNNEA